MATIILNGVETDANPVSASDLNDKLTVSGGPNGLDAQMLAGRDLVEIDQEGEDIVNSSVFGGDGDDSLVVDSSAFSDAKSDITLSGGDGNDSIHVGFGEIRIDDEFLPEGMVTLTGKVNGNDGDDDIRIARADGAIAQGGGGDDEIELGYWSELDVPGSRGDTTIVDTSVNGGSGDDEIELEESIKSTDSTVNGGEGADTIEIEGSLIGTIEINAASSANFITSSAVNGSDDKDKIHIGEDSDGEDVSLINTIVNGNKGHDWIKSYGPLAETDGSIIAGGAGHDTIAVADAGDLTVRGGSGKDLLRVGSGQTVTGGPGADTFSIEFAGGAVIQDFDAIRTDNGETSNCFCSDVIQVDGNKIIYDTYAYKQTKQKFTSASSWVGNVRVKAFEDQETCTTNVKVETGAIKTNTVNATAFLKYRIGTTVIPDATLNDVGINFPGGAFTIAGVNYADNGNSPRPTNEVKSIGIGLGSVTGVILERGVTPAPAGGFQNYRDVYIPNLTVYTKTNFEKGDFSFLNQTNNGNAKCTVTQTLVFDDITRATITNHNVLFGVSKSSDETSLYELKFGTANFQKIRTGNANLILTKNLVDKTYYPTPNQISNNLVQKTINGVKDIAVNTIQTEGGKYKYTRTANATANAGVELNLSSMRFDLWTKRNSGLGVTEGVVYSKQIEGQFGVLTGVGTAELFVKYENILWTQATGAGLLTLTAATQVTNSAQGYNTPAMNFLTNTPVSLPTFNKSGVAGIIFKKQYFSGKTAAISGTEAARAVLTAKIGIDGTGNATVQASLPTWLGRALIKGTPLNPTECTYPSTLTNNIAEGFGNGQHNKYTPASIEKSQKGKFGTKYMWTSDGFRLNSEWTYTITNFYSNSGQFLGSTGNPFVNPSPILLVPGSYYSTTSTYTTGNFIPYLPFSNGCDTSSGQKEYSCRETTRVNASTAILGGSFTFGLQEKAALYNNNAFFSASQFTVKALAAEGMGDNAIDAQGAPFRVLFFDSKGADNGLYVMSGTANYKGGDVTAINTNPTGTSAFGGKQTIVNVIGGKGYEISLSDINFV